MHMSKLLFLSRNLFILFLFFLPWQTAFLYRAPVVNGSVWEFGKLLVYASELLLWSAVILIIIRLALSHFILQGGVRRAIVLGAIGVALWAGIIVWFSSDSELALQGVTWIMAGVVSFMLITKSENPGFFLNAFLLGLIPVAFLGVWQFFQQETVAFVLLGLSGYDPQTLGVPVVMNAGERLLRASGSFPHPNIFGGYMAAGILLLISQYLSNAKSFFNRPFVYFLSLFLFTFGLLVSFSRSAWIMVIIGVVVLAVATKKHLKARGKSCMLRHSVIILLATVIFFVVPYRQAIFSRLFSTERIEQISVSQRANQLGRAVPIVKGNFLFGVGIHNYTVELMGQSTKPNLFGYELQPVHSVPILVLAELGVFGFIVIAGAFVVALKKKNGVRLVFPLLSLTPVLLFDHYLWSLYPGIILFWLLLGFGHRFSPSIPHDIHK